MHRIVAIIQKDIKQILRNKFILVISFLSIFMFAVVFYLMPNTVNEEIKIGLMLEQGREIVESQLNEAENGLEIIWANSTDELIRLVETNEVMTAFSLTREDDQYLVSFYFSSQTPTEIKEAAETIGQEIGYTLLGHEIALKIDEKVIGPDMLGQQIPLRNRMRIVMLTFLIVIEIFAMANLLTEELQRKTIFALLITPTNLLEFITAKALVGIILAFTEGLLSATLLNVITLGTIISIIVFLLLGSVIATGLAFVVGSSSSDFSSLTGWATLAMFIMVIPATSILFPALSSPWMKLIPTYPMIQILDGVVNFNASIFDYQNQIAYLFFFASVLFGLSFLLFRKKVYTS